MRITQYDLMINFLLILCVLGLFYIFIMIIAIAAIASKQRTKDMYREVDIIIKYENDKRIYEKREKVTINKANKPHKEIYHSYKAIDKRIIEQNFLLERIVEINDNKGHILQENIEHEIVGSSDFSPQYIRENIEQNTRIIKLDRSGKIINNYLKKQTYGPFKMVKPLTHQIIKSEIIPTRIPIVIERDRIKVFAQESQLGIETNEREKTVLDVMSFADTSKPALFVTSEANEVSNIVAKSQTHLTSDSITLDLDIRQIKALVANIDIKQIPTIGSHIKIKQVPVYVNETNIKEMRCPSTKSDFVSTQVIQAEVPIIVEKVITREMSPNLVPLTSHTTKILKDFML